MTNQQISDLARPSVAPVRGRLRPIARSLGGVLLAASLIACSSHTAPVKLAGRPAGTVTGRLDGVYRATLKVPLIGPISAHFTAAPSETGFVANTRPGVAWDMIGGVQGLLGQVFAPFLFPGGVILTWNSTAPGPEGPGEGWLGVGGIKSAGVKTRMTAPGAPVELLTSDGRTIGTMRLRPEAPNAAAMADYPALAEGVKAAFARSYYDPAMANSSRARSYFSQLASAARSSRDDVEFIFGAVVAGRGLKGSMPLVLREMNPALRALHAIGVAGRDLPTIRTSFDEQTGIATIKFEAFLDAADVDAAFEKALSWNPTGLLVDLRGCPGITLASLRAASWLVDAPVRAGSFFGPAHRADALAGRLDHFPTFEIDSPGSVERLERELDERGAASVVIVPAGNDFRGPVAVLTTRKTTTSAEPLAWVLVNSAHERLRVFGQTTAGRPMVSRPVSIGQDWALWLAAADYLPPTGERLDRGVRPHFADPSKDAAKSAALEFLQGG